MHILITGAFFYLAWGAITWLGQDDAEIEHWDQIAVSRQLPKLLPGVTIPGRPARIRMQLFMMMVAWPFMGRLPS